MVVCVEESRSGRRAPRGGEPAGRGEPPLRGLQRMGGAGETRVRRQSANRHRRGREPTGMTSPNSDADGSAQATMWRGSAPCRKYRPPDRTARRGDTPKPGWAAVAQAIWLATAPAKPAAAGAPIRGGGCLRCAGRSCRSLPRSLGSRLARRSHPSRRHRARLSERCPGRPRHTR